MAGGRERKKKELDGKKKSLFFSVLDIIFLYY